MLVSNIKERCKKKGITIAELERTVGLGNGVIARWDVMSPRLENVALVANYFKCSVDSLMREPKQ